jgi:hypothetical protein
MAEYSSRTARCGRVISHVGFDLLNRGKANAETITEPPDRAPTESRGLAKGKGGYAALSDECIDPANNGRPRIHVSILDYIWIIINSSCRKFHPGRRGTAFDTLLPMLKELIRRALEEKRMSMRQASLAAGMNQGWLKQFLSAPKPMDPGISAMISLANVLGIDKVQLLEAVEQDARGGKRDRNTLEAALRAVADMTPAERAAFLASLPKR